MKSIRRIKVKLQEMIKPNISNKTKNILGVDRVEASKAFVDYVPLLLHHYIIVYCCFA